MEATAKRPRIYSRAKIQTMMARVQQTLAANAEAERTARDHRASDPLEQAKLALQRAGVAVFHHSQLAPGSTLLVVGTRTMSPADVISHAERYGRW